MKARTLLGLAYAACILSLTRAYPQGADPSACPSLSPRGGHGGSSQTSTSPYIVTVSSTSYTPGGAALTVTLESSCPATTSFKGFLLTARSARTASEDTVLGTLSTPAEAKDVCTGGRTHISRSPKTSISFTWTPPASDEGPVVFRATFVQTTSVYWVDVHSDIVQGGTPETNGLVNSSLTTAAPGSCPTAPTAAPQQPPSSFTKDPDCGTTKGCYSDCSGNTCGLLMTWVPDTANNLVSITLKAFVGTGDRYVAFGLSSDRAMGGDSVTECTIVSGNVGVFNSENIGKRNSRIGPTGLNLLSGVFADGILTCEFTRNTTSTDNRIFPLDATKYNIFLARGPAFQAGVSEHDSIPPTSAEAVSLQDVTVDTIAGAFNFPLIKAHGSLMIVAWIFAASIGIIVARYFKPVWPNSTWFGQKIWFQIHRACMVLVLFATVVAFIIIFVEVGGYSEISGETFQKAHPVLGIIVTILCVINPIMALFRPHPNTPKRPIFNWAHWAVGTGAHVMGVVTIFFGVSLEKSGAPQHMIYVLAAYCAWQFVIQIIFEIIQYTGRNSARREAYEMTVNGEPGKAASGEQSTFGKRLLLAIHIVVMTGFIIALLVILNVGKDHDH